LPQTGFLIGVASSLSLSMVNFLLVGSVCFQYDVIPEIFVDN
jgi:hypothetical protein